MNKNTKVNAAILIIGNEILSGRTQDTNTSTLTPIELSQVAIVEVFVSWVLPDNISLPIINIAALTFVFLFILNV